MTESTVVQPLRQTEVVPLTRRMFIRDLVVNMLIGVHRHERDGRQRVRINIDLSLIDDTGVDDDRLASVVSYETLVHEIRRICDSGHVNLVETLAERIARLCFDDRRVRRAVVRVEKLDVFADTASVGVEIERSNPKS
jgi:dihydroneopterin aldolase